MAESNDWATFGLTVSRTSQRRRGLFKNIDTSRMSWHDCHIGFTFLAIPCFFAFPWFLVGMIASMNGGYASAFTVRPPGYYSRPLWWLAFFANIVVFVLFAAFELTGAKQAGLGTVDLLVLAIITKLAMGQLTFLFRIRREGGNAALQTDSLEAGIR